MHERLDELRDPAVVVDRGLRIRAANAAWDAFFVANGGAPGYTFVGRSVLDGMTEAVRPRYEALLTGVLETGRPAQELYDCPSPDRAQRFSLNVTPLPDGAGLLLHHHLVSSRPLSRHHELGAYINGSGLVVQCCHCRRVRRADGPEVWEWVPSLLEAPVRNLSHSFCESCFERYYPELGAAREERAAG